MAVQVTSEGFVTTSTTQHGSGDRGTSSDLLKGKDGIYRLTEAHVPVNCIKNSWNGGFAIPD